MSDAVFSKPVISGDSQALAQCQQAHFAGGSFDFNSVVPMPPELKVEESSAVSTGYAALYGDWTEPAAYWTWKEAASALGYPFPLQSREQLLACIRSLDCAEMYLEPARQSKENMEKYGHGTWYGWCKEHWGTTSNAEDARVTSEPQEIVVRFTVAGAFPKAVVAELSKKCPDLEIRVLHVDENLRRGRDYKLKNGREVQRMKRSPLEILADVRDGRAAV